jgi:L-cysteine S-thiosulfotransferase
LRFHSLIAATFAAAACVCFAAPDAIRAELTARLQKQLPETTLSDYALGSAAFDPELRDHVRENAGANADVIAAGKAAWNAKFKNGRSLAGCFPNGGRRIAAVYPQYDPRLKRVITLEMAINQCLKSHNQPLLEPGDAATMGPVVAYLRSLAVGQKIAVRVPSGAEGGFELGRRLYFSRLGQRNFACASCHVQGAGKRYGDVAISPTIGQATHWPTIRDGKPVSLQARMRECLEFMGAAPFPAGSEELNQLEYFITYLSNGLPVAASPWRPH